MRQVVSTAKKTGTRLGKAGTVRAPEPRAQSAHQIRTPNGLTYGQMSATMLLLSQGVNETGS